MKQGTKQNIGTGLAIAAFTFAALAPEDADAQQKQTANHVQKTGSSKKAAPKEAPFVDPDNVVVAGDKEFIIDDKAHIVVELGTGEVLLEKNSKVSRKFASVVKEITVAAAIQALEEGYLKEDTPMIISQKAINIVKGQRACGTAGRAITFGGLIKGAMVHSCNNAGVQIALEIAGHPANRDRIIKAGYTPGTIDAFIHVFMQDILAKAGASSAVKIGNPVGLPRKQVSPAAAIDNEATAEDINKITIYFAKAYRKYLADYMALPTAYVPGFGNLSNTNPYLKTEKYETLLSKTGYTRDSKSCATVILRWRDANGRPHDWAITTLANSGKEGRKLNIDNIYMAAQEVRKIREKHPDYKASVKSALKETFPARAMQPAPTSTTEKNSVPSTRQNFPAKDDVPQREFSYPRQIYHKEL